MVYQRGLIAVDGSTQSLSAATLGKQMVQSGLIGTVTLLHVTSIPLEIVDDIDVYEKEAIELVNKKLLEQGQSVVDKVKRIFHADSIPVNTRVMLGDPADQIIAAAKEYDVVVLGSRGLSSFKEIVLGSVSNKVMNSAKCPVIIIRG